MMCPRCSSNKYKKNGKKNDFQRYKCNKCSREWIDGHNCEPLTNVNSSSISEELNYKHITDNVVDGKAPTLKTLLNKFKVSEDDWKVTNFKINQWDVSAKEEIDGKIYWNTHTNYQAIFQQFKEQKYLH